MDTDAHELRESDLTETVIGSAFEISKVLGAGFLEKVYERALIRELMLRGVSAKAQVSFPVCYKGQYIGEYVADLVVEEKLIVELKCVDRFANDHLAQCINYPESFPSSGCSSDQLPTAPCGMEAHSRPVAMSNSPRCNEVLPRSCPNASATMLPSRIIRFIKLHSPGQKVTPTSACSSPALFKAPSAVAPLKRSGKMNLCRSTNTAARIVAISLKS